MALPKKVALTVDLEEWTVPQEFSSRRVPEAIKLEVACVGLKKILHILAMERIKATFFVTAWFAQRNHALLRNILEAGHEIANHGLEHSPRLRRTWNEEIKTIMESTRIIEESARVKLTGYREPYLAATKTTILALMQLGYRYDSSIMGTWLLGKYQWVVVPAVPFEWNTYITGTEGNLIELPLSTFSKLRVPVGWWWFRKNFGESITFATANLLFRLGEPFIMNVHTWELVEVPVAYQVPSHIKYNCGERSTQQIHHLIKRLKYCGAEFVLMKNMALDQLANSR